MLLCISGTFQNLLATSRSHAGIRIVTSDGTTIIGAAVDPIPVGTCETLTCTTDLDVDSIEWVLVGGANQEDLVVVSSSSQEAELVFAPITDRDHEMDYKCVVTSPYGTQEQRITVVVEGINRLFTTYAGCIEAWQVVYRG